MPESVLLGVTSRGTFVTCDDLHWAPCLYEAESGIFAGRERKDDHFVATKRQIAKAKRFHPNRASDCFGYRANNRRYDRTFVLYGGEPVTPPDFGGGLGRTAAAGT